MTVGSVPNTQGLGLEKVGIELDKGGYLRGGPGVADAGVRDLRRG